VGGDRVWAFADHTFLSWKFVEAADLMYHFVFNDAKNPTRCQIYPEARNLGVTLSANTEWLLDFEMELLEAGHQDFPGSIAWRRPSKIGGVEVNEYILVQVIDEHGDRIEPAWSKFVDYQNAGHSPGAIFYREVAR